MWFLCHGQEKLAWWAVHAPPGTDLGSGFICSSNLTVSHFVALSSWWVFYIWIQDTGVMDMRQMSRETLSEPWLAYTHRLPDRCVSLEASGDGIIVDFGFFLGIDKNISSLGTSKDSLAG